MALELKLHRTEPRAKPIRTVLVAGFRDPVNPATRLCIENFLTPTHVDELSQKCLIIPNLDALILVVTEIGHETSWKVKDAFKDKPIFHLKGGVSSIKEEFLNTVYGHDILKNLRSQEIPFATKVFYILGRFFNPGDHLEYKTFKERSEKLTGFQSENNLSNIFCRFKEKGVFKAGSGKGRHVYLGLTDKIYDDLLKYGLFLEKDHPVDGKDKVQILVPNQLVPEDIQNVSPQHIPEEPLVLETSMPAHIPPAPIPAQPDHSELSISIQLLLDAMASQQAEISSLKEIIQGQRMMTEELENRLVGRVRKEVDSGLNVHMQLFKLAPRLRGMDAAKLDKMMTLIGLFEDLAQPAQVNPPPQIGAADVTK